MFARNKFVDWHLCFVLMPFQHSLYPVYTWIKDVANEHGLSCIRADDISSVGVIVDQIWGKIQEAQIIVADATNKNPNVFYEMGLAHALGKDVIILAQSIDDIPFDLRHRRAIVYNIDQLNEVTNSFSAAIEELMWKPVEVKQWLETSDKNIRIGLSFPTDKTTVQETPIPAFGQIVGLTANPTNSIVGYVITNREYEQGSSRIDKSGYWKIDAIHLGAVTHRLLFRVMDESGRIIVKSKEITVFKR
jgi:hypothetical protein